MYEERIRVEVAQLLKLKRLLDADRVLPLRFDAERRSLNSRDWALVIRGIESPTSATSRVAQFNVSLHVAQGYPWTAMPKIAFDGPVPFHPHIFPDGRICWGSGSKAQPDLTLVDWFRGLIEYLQHNQDSGSLYQVNPNSPANQEALTWWQRNRRQISKVVPPIDMDRLRFWISQCRG